MKEPLRARLVANCVGSIGFLGLAVLALARASAVAAAPADAPSAVDNNSYRNFDVALYVEIRDMRHMMSYVGRPGDGLTGFCFTNPDDRERFRKLVAFTAGLFDEMIFDDLFIFDCRCELCQKAKGDLSWTEYRLKVMKEVGENLVVKNAKSVNPKINLIIKPPNWYEQYQFSGYNLEAQSKAFDMIYTGTETRDPENTAMHLQPYQSYGIMRYFEHIKPG